MVLLLLLAAAGAWIAIVLLRERSAATIALSALFVVSLATFTLTAKRAREAARSRVPGGVTVLKGRQVGIYDIRVVKSDEPGALVEWLQENDFAFDESDREVFEHYIDRGWCFVVARVDADAAENAPTSEIRRDGLVAPLIARFETDQPYYPLALTALTGQETEVLLYTLADHKMTCGGRVELRSAGRLRRDEWWPDRVSKYSDYGIVAPESFFGEDVPSLNYITKFHDTLDPSEMQEDLRLRRAPDDKSRREFRWAW